MTCMRRAINANRRDRIRNDDNREMIEAWVDFNGRHTISWFCHVMRMKPAWILCVPVAVEGLVTQHGNDQEADGSIISATPHELHMLT